MKLSNILYHKIIFFCLCCFLIADIHGKEYKLNSEHKKRLQQAKSLRKSGLIEESKHVYKNLLKDYPYLKEALDPLKLILKNHQAPNAFSLKLVKWVLDFLCINFIELRLHSIIYLNYVYNFLFIVWKGFFNKYF